MASSYEKINYVIRPAKNVERKILCESFRKLTPFAPLEEYRYIGFGSTYFSDFSLLHKALGISEMVSIEKDEDNEDRFKFNRPYRCIKLEFGESNDVLPRLSWAEKTILWLDYDGTLDKNVLADIKFAVGNIASGSIVVASVNAMPPGNDKTRVEALVDLVGEEKVPKDISPAQLSRRLTPVTLQRIINNEFLQSLSERNGGKRPGERTGYQQLFNFVYADGAQMLTVGGLLFSEDQREQVAACRFEEAPFVRSGEEHYKIEVPNLTYRELRHIDRQLPTHAPENIETDGIPPDDILKYSCLYKYFPMFAETEI